MPRYGSMADVRAFMPNPPEIQTFKIEPWALKGAQIINLLAEVNGEKSDVLLPKAMHPSIPSYAMFNVTVYPDSPVGKFGIGEVRVASRAGVRPRGFVLRSFVDNDAARRELANRWGYPVAPGDVYMRTFHDRVVARVSSQGRVVLELELLDRDYISGGDIQYLSSMHLARNKEDGKLILAQIDPEWTFSRAERGRPRINTFDASAFGAGDNLVVENIISVSYTICDVTLGSIRYYCDPDKPAFQGTTQIAA
jgi:hypothetical protein